MKWALGMFEDRAYRPIAYHDTWIALDPMVGCPYECGYCILQHWGGTGRQPRRMIDPGECVDRLLAYPLFVRDRTPLAIGCETDILHAANVHDLMELLVEMRARGIGNPVALITKSPLSLRILDGVRSSGGDDVFFFLSYSGLGREYEPNFDRRQLEANFRLARDRGFRTVHFWRPLIPRVNTTEEGVRRMLSFARSAADAVVFVGLKMNPELNVILRERGVVSIPDSMMHHRGEWIERSTVDRIYRQAGEICPELPVYRHSSCALAVLRRVPNHTATVYRDDICGSSQCPAEQRRICADAKRIPSGSEIAMVLARLGRQIPFVRRRDSVFLDADMGQEEVSYVLHNLCCPVKVRAMKTENLFRGNIHEGLEEGGRK